VKDYTVKKGDLLIFADLKRGNSVSFHVGEIKEIKKSETCKSTTTCFHMSDCGGNFEKIIIKWEDRCHTNMFCYNRKKGVDWLKGGKYSKLIIVWDSAQIRFFNLFRRDKEISR